MRKSVLNLLLLTVVATALLAITSPLPAEQLQNLVHMGIVQASNGEALSFPIYLENADSLAVVVAPLIFDPGDQVTIDSVNFVGSRFAGLGSFSAFVDNASHRLSISFTADPGKFIPFGDGLIANAFVRTKQNAPTQIIMVDSAFIAPSTAYALKDVHLNDVIDGFTAGAIDITTTVPIINLNPTVFYFTTTVGVNPPKQTLHVTNLGVDPLTWNETYKPTWLNVSAVSGTAPSDVDLMPDVSALAIGDYLDSIAITDAVAIIKTKWAIIHLSITENAVTGLAGTVKDTHDNVISGATVEVWDNFPGGSNPYSTTTAPDGSFSLPGVPDGSYQLYSYKDGYYPALQNVTAPSSGIAVVLETAPQPSPTNRWINLYCDESFLNGYLLPKGTVVEATDQSGVVCGQFFVHEVGKYGFMPVYRDDPATGVDEGADSLEVLKINLNKLPASPFPTPVWTFNGDIQKICLNTNVIETRCISLHKGWNLISWNVDTQNDNVESVIAGIKGCIDVILGFEQGGATYDPSLPQFSTLESLDHFHGYWFRMDCDTQICVTGTKVDPRAPIALEQNWNLVSYLPDDQDSVTHALGSIYPKLLVALGYDNGGQTFDPAHPELATLMNLKPEFGYWLKTTAAASLVYPGPAFSSGLNNVIQTSMKAYPPAAGVIPTTEWLDLYGDGIKLDGKLIPAGSKVDVYTEQGVLCGEATVRSDGKIDFTPVYRDDKNTPVVEGADYGGKLSLAVNGTPVQESVTFSGFGDRIRVGSLTSAAKSAESLPRSFELTQNYPNPFNPGTVISFTLPQTSRAKVEVFNVLGVKVNTLIDRTLPAGRYSVAWEGTDSNGKPTASGIYFYKLTAGDFTDTKKMLLVK